MIDILIVDDETRSGELLHFFIKKYISFDFKVTEVTSIKGALSAIEKVGYDIAFLDITLKDGTGFDLLASVENRTFEVIFVTGHDNFAIKAFKKGAVDYLLKPIAIDELVAATNKAYHKIMASRNRVKKNKLRYDKTLISVATLKLIKLIEADTILYLKSEGRYTTLYLTDGKTILSSKNIGEFEKKIDTQVFFRVHNSYIVNIKHLDYISKVDGYYCVLKNNKITLPIAKRKQLSLNKFLRVK